MTSDPNAEYLKATQATEERIRSVKRDLDNLRKSVEAVNSENEISFSIDDIDAGWIEIQRFADIIAKTDPHLAHGFLVAHLQSLDGWYGAGRLLSRSEVVSRRFSSKAHAAARAAKANKNAPIWQAEAEIISQELKKLRSQNPEISAYGAAPKIGDTVNERLKRAQIPGRPSKNLSPATIARRILDFNL